MPRAAKAAERASWYQSIGRVSPIFAGETVRVYPDSPKTFKELVFNRLEPTSATVHILGALELPAAN